MQAGHAHAALAFLSAARRTGVPSRWAMRFWAIHPTRRHWRSPSKVHDYKRIATWAVFCLVRHLKHTVMAVRWRSAAHLRFTTTKNCALAVWGRGCSYLFAYAALFTPPSFLKAGQLWSRFARAIPYSVKPVPSGRAGVPNCGEL